MSIRQYSLLTTLVIFWYHVVDVVVVHWKSNHFGLIPDLILCITTRTLAASFICVVGYKRWILLLLLMSLPRVVQ